jgi:hypothetical protein
VGIHAQAASFIDTPGGNCPALNYPSHRQAGTTVKIVVETGYIYFVPSCERILLFVIHFIFLLFLYSVAILAHLLPVVNTFLGKNKKYF